MQYNAVCMHMYTTVIKKLAGLRGWGWSPTSSSSLSWRVSKGRPCRRGGHERFLYFHDASGCVFEQSESPHGRHAGGATLRLRDQEVSEYLQARKRAQFFGIDKVSVERGRVPIREQLHERSAFGDV